MGSRQLVLGTKSDTLPSKGGRVSLFVPLFLLLYRQRMVLRPLTIQTQNVIKDQVFGLGPFLLSLPKSFGPTDKTHSLLVPNVL